MTPTLYLSASADDSLVHLRLQTGMWREGHELTTIYLLLASRPVADRVRQTLGNTINIHYVQIYDLGRSILTSARRPSFELNDISIRRVVRETLEGMARDGELSTFAPVVGKPGFTDLMVTWLREMKSQGIHPDDVSKHARTSGGERDRQLAGLYQRYQQFLQESDTSDSDGLLWLAAESLERDENLFRCAGPLFVLGFDQFTPIQLRILKQLAVRFGHTGVYLNWDQQRDETSRALTRLASTRQQLIEALEPAQSILASTRGGRVNSALLHLHRSLFEARQTEQPVDAGDAVRLVEAPSREEEVRWAMRAVKQLLLDGVPYGDIVLASPNPSVYQRLAETLAVEYGVPIQADQTLSTNPAASALISILGLHPEFPWRQTFEVLRSPYIRQSWLTSDQLDLLDRLTRERPVVAGVEQWRYALRPLPQGRDQAQDDDDRGAPPLAAQVDEAELADLEAGLFGFVEHLTPPGGSDYRTYVLWIQEAILGLIADELDSDEPHAEAVTPSLDLLGCCTDGPYAERDLRAMRTVLSALRQLVVATDLVPVADEAPSWSAFATELANMLPALTVQPDPRTEAVVFSALEANRSLAVDYLFILGLSEGEFPSPPPPDPLYTSQERQEHPLPLRRYLDGQDACLWWQVTSNCRRQLTLLRPWADENGAEWPPSPYWTEVQSRYRGLRPIHVGTAPAMEVEQAASHNEFLTALASLGATEAPATLSGVWKQVQIAYAVMAQRGSWREPGIYEGVIQADDLLRELATRFGPSHPWSASRLNRYGSCPYGFLAEQILKLEARADSAEGLDAATRGSILHAILEHLYRALAEKKISPDEEHVGDVLALLNDACDQVLESAPQYHGFRPGPLWRSEQDELRRLLATLVKWECDENGATPDYVPYRQELAFGFGQISPVYIPVPNGAGFYLHGIIDRVDRSDDARLRVVDYKSGSTPYSLNDVRNGLAMQTALYALAAEELLDGQVSQSLFLHIPKRTSSGKLDFSGPVSDSADVQSAVAAASGFVARIQNGVFPSAPAKPQAGGLVCSSWCQLSPMCRVTRQSLAKGKRLMERA